MGQRQIDFSSLAGECRPSGDCGSGWNRKPEMHGKIRSQESDVYMKMCNFKPLPAAVLLGALSSRVAFRRHLRSKHLEQPGLSEDFTHAAITLSR
jgi:hypothetical protein